MRHLKIPYMDVLSMPTYERRFFLTRFIEENEKRKETIESQQMNSGTVKEQEPLRLVVNNLNLE